MTKEYRLVNHIVLKEIGLLMSTCVINEENQNVTEFAILDHARHRGLLENGAR